MKLDGLIDSGLKEIGPRLSLIGLLPLLALFGLIAALLASGAPGSAPDSAKLIAAAKDPGGGDALLLVAGLLALALVVHPLQITLVRLLEGYWGDSPGARSLAAWCTARQARRRQALVDALRHEGEGPPDAAALQRMQASAAALLQGFPALPERLMPTALGNVLRAAEDRPQRAYGLDGVTIWPRLFPLLPDAMKGLVVDARNQMDVALRFAAVFVLAALACAALLWRHPPWAALAVVALFLAWLSYRAGVQAAAAYGQLVEVAFDLHRFSLYPALHLALPDDPEAERALNAQVSAVLRQRVPPGYRYIHPPPPKGG